MWFDEDLITWVRTSRGLVSVVRTVRAIECRGVGTGFFGVRTLVTEMAAVTAHFGLVCFLLVVLRGANFTKRGAGEPSCKLHSLNLKLDRLSHEESALGELDFSLQKLGNNNNHYLIAQYYKHFRMRSIVVSVLVVA